MLRPTWVAAMMVVAAYGGPSVARAATIGVDVYGGSYHFERRDDDGYAFNEFNPGAGIDWVIARGPHQTVFADLAMYRDSYRNPNRYVTLTWTHQLIGPVQGGLALAVASSRSVNDQEPFMAPVPVLSWRADRVAVQVLYLAAATGLNGIPALAAYGTLYPFGPARVAASGHSGAGVEEPSAAGTGVEFTAGRHFRLNGLEAAAIAVRHRSGRRSWRLAADLGAVLSSQRRIRVADGIPPRTDRGHVERFAFTLRAARLFHAAERRRMSLFTGFGPILGYTNDDPELDLRTWRLGATGVAGVEWRVARSASLAAESGLDAVYRSGRDEYTSDVTVRQETDKRFELVPRGVRLGITGWFW